MYEKDSTSAFNGNLPPSVMQQQTRRKGKRKRNNLYSYGLV